MGDSNQPNKWNAANLVTMSRIAVTPFFWIFIFRDGMWAKWTAGLLFAWGAVSDYLDGYLARRYHLKSNFGTLLDPLADKILFLSVFLAFMQMGLAPAWMVIVIAAREFLITGFRQVAQNRNVIIAASRAGKHKTVSQILAISFILAIVCVKATMEQYQVKWDVALSRLGEAGNWVNLFVDRGPFWLMLYATIMSVLSGLDYFIKNRHVLSEEKSS
jgi:CDP-diacylglycerol--glycerol-3-phosphate 3-phosphatidyltransferase